MIVFPDDLQAELQAAAARLDSRKRHLLLIDDEGLHVLERWRTERHFQGMASGKPKGIYSRDHFLL